jgi:glutamate 5-kinase
MKPQPSRSVARRAKRIVVKVGSSILTNAGALRRRVFGELARQVSSLQDDGREVVIVSSGAIAIGSHVLGWTHPGRSIPEKQAAAAVGQIGLVELYRKLFAKRGKQVAQILLTRTGLEDRERFLNARRTLLTLLRLGVVPIVNENDTVATEEIRFGDNDNLSANIVNLVAADLLILLTDVEGLFHEPPRKGAPKPPLYDVVGALTPEIEAAAQGSGHAFGRGGMTTKLEAARAAARSGAATIVCSGNAKDALLRACAGERIGTLFLAGQKLSSRKHWLAFTTKPRGEITVDDGAARALLERGRSLLPAGVVSVRGSFGRGDPVSCVDLRGRELARGLASYASEDVARIQGRPTREIAALLGFSNGDEVIHRDDLVVVPGSAASVKT